VRRLKTELITYSLEADIALIGLNRTAKRNAIDDDLLKGLADAAKAAVQEAKVAIIYGHGAHFCAGLDLAKHAGKTPAEAFTTSRQWHAAFDLIQRGEIPFICALQGAVIGGGIELAAATHIRIADETAFFALPEGRRGLFVGGGGSVRVARLMGLARMTDLMLTGRVLPAQEGLQANLVQYVVGKGDSLSKAKELAARIAENALLSNFAILQALPRIQDMAQDDGLFVESLMSAFTQTTPQAAQRIDEFLQKRAKPAASKSGKPIRSK
jgi:enoyl-CoA hydratase/carnithine racemase